MKDLANFEWRPVHLVHASDQPWQPVKPGDGPMEYMQEVLEQGLGLLLGVEIRVKPEVARRAD
jgi:hypothetical protein